MKKDAIPYLKEKLSTDPKYMLNGFQRIWREQTEDEKQYGLVLEKNEVGFSWEHVLHLTPIAKKYERKGEVNQDEIAYLYTVMPRYAGQLYKLWIKDMSNWLDDIVVRRALRGPPYYYQDNFLLI